YRHGAGRGFRLLRRVDRRGDSARDRAGTRLSIDSAVDGAVGGAANELAALANLFRRDFDPVADRLDMAGTAATRAGAGAAADGLCHGGETGWGQRLAHHLSPPDPGVHQPDYRGDDS